MMNRNKESALYVAYERGRHDVVKQLLNYPSVSLLEMDDGLTTSLHVAASAGHLECESTGYIWVSGNIPRTTSGIRADSSYLGGYSTVHIYGTVHVYGTIHEYGGDSHLYLGDSLLIGERSTETISGDTSGGRRDLSNHYSAPVIGG
ncbi:hypothetical protein WN943_000496 [Citrus x changshan-huyou]